MHRYFNINTIILSIEQQGHFVLREVPVNHLLLLQEGNGK